MQFLKSSRFLFSSFLVLFCALLINTPVKASCSSCELEDSQYSSYNSNSVVNYNAAQNFNYYDKFRETDNSYLYISSNPMRRPPAITEAESMSNGVNVNRPRRAPYKNLSALSTVPASKSYYEPSNSIFTDLDSPCGATGSLFPGLNTPCGYKKFKRNCGCDQKLITCEDCDQPKEKTKVFVRNVPTGNDRYDFVHRGCQDFAPISFEYVDFRIKNGNKYEPYNQKLGNYRFRIFGCRRNQKSAYLNVGRTMQRDMNFFEVFDNVYGDCLKQVKMPTDLCDENNPNPFPEYILTAEITNYFMNVCDEYDWNKAENKEERFGSSEMTITWRLMDLTKSNVYWKGTSTGYGELDYGEYNGEILLVERAFEDALISLRNLEGFEQQLAQRQTPENMQAQKIALAQMERAFNPAKCQFASDIDEKSGLTQTAGIISENGGIYKDGKRYDSNGNLIDENGNVISSKPCVKCNKKSCVKCKQAPAPEYVELVPMVPVIPVVMEQGGVVAPTEVSKIIDEKSGVISSGSSVIEEAGLNSDGDNIAESKIIDEKGDSISSGFGAESDWINIPLEDPAKVQIVENAFSSGKGNFCIENQLTFKEMTPLNLYKVRASIVSIENSKGKKGAGLIISDQFILTSADLIIKEDNVYNIKTINGVEFKANAFRVSPNKNVALMLLEGTTQFTPLPLNLELPEIGKGNYFTLGLFDLDEGGEGYVEDKGKVVGYRYSEDKGAEIIVDTYTQGQSVGGALVDQRGNIYGIAHSGKRLEDTPDMFIPIESALKSLDVELCGRQFLNQVPPSLAKPVSTAVDNTKDFKDPKAMDGKERK